MASTRNNINGGETTEDFIGVYEEDLVALKDNKNKIGIVLKAYRNDDSDDDSNDSSDGEEDGDKKLEKGKVMIGWHSLNPRWNDEDTAVVDENTVKLLDRSLLPGDVVRWVTKQNGNQKGHVKSVQVFVDICIVGTNHMLKNINANKLLPFSKFSHGVPVVMGPWLGCVKDVAMELTMRLKNNSKCVVVGEAINSLADITDQREEDTTFYCSDFYPGQQLQGPARVFKEARWIVGPKPIMHNNLRVKAVVEDVKVTHIDIEWHVSGYSGSNEDSVMQPDPVVTSNELCDGNVHVLNNFNEATIQIGDKTFYVLTQEDVEHCNTPRECHEKRLKSDAVQTANKTVCSATSAANVQSDEEDENTDEEHDGEEIATLRPSHGSSSATNVASSARRGASRPRRKRHAHLQKKRKRYKPPVSMVAGEKVCVEVSLTRTIANVIWQDGTLQNDIESTCLYPVIHLDELEFFPGDFVVDKRETSNDNETFGVVQCADFTGRLCDIRWLSFVNNATETLVQLEQDVSVYEISDHPDFTFRPSDTVVRLGLENPADRGCNNDGVTLAPAGEVIEVNTDGKVEVLWVDGTTCSVLPSQLYVVSTEEDEWDVELEDGEEGFESGDEVWETSSEVSEGGTADLQQQLSPLEDVITRSLAALNPSTNNSTLENPATAQGTPDHVIGMNRRTAEFISALDEQFKSSDAQNSEDGGEQTKDQNEQTKDSNEQNKDQDEDLENNTNASSIFRQEKFTGDDQEQKVSFYQLDVAPSSHHFVSYICAPLNARTFNAAVMKDTRLLQSHLPCGIVVKSFDDRIDLFSALITGPPATPYEDGLFCFDVQLPDDYPASPPNVHYHSYCSQRLNPNLYEEGKVCVSLLGTWSGKGNETWTSKSTIHQLFLSIQSLILNEEPYFNEAGYEKQKGTAEGQENSRMYNEMAVVKTLQSIQKMISRPPEIFKEEVIEHFKKRLPILLKRFEDWLQTKAEDEQEGTNNLDTPQFLLLPLSKGFRVTVHRQLAQLKSILQQPPF